MKKVRTHCTSPNIFLVPHRGITLVFFSSGPGWKFTEKNAFFRKKKILIWEGEKLLTKMPQAMPNIRILIFFKIFQTWKRLLINPYIHHLRFGRVSYHSVIPEGVTKSVKKFFDLRGGWNKNKKGENKILTYKIELEEEKSIQRDLMIPKVFSLFTCWHLPVRAHWAQPRQNGGGAALPPTVIMGVGGMG